MRIKEAFERLLARLHGRKANYQLTFKSPAGKHVLRDLTRFCRGTETTFNADPHITAMLEGRRQVLLRIEQHLTFNPEELAVIYRAAVLDPTGANDG